MPVEIRRLVALFFGLKVGIALFGLSLLCVHYMFAKLWFENALTPSEMEAVIATNHTVDVENEDGLTGLMYGSIRGEWELIQALLAMGADVDLVSEKHGKNTALHFACYNGRYDASIAIIKLLVKSRANVRMRNTDGRIPLHYLLFIDNLQDRTDLMMLFVKHGANINMQNNEGNTIMHLAVEMHNSYWIEMVKQTFSSLLNMDIKNVKGNTPHEYALELGFTDIDDILMKPLKQRIETAQEGEENGMNALVLAISRFDAPDIQRMIAGGTFDLNQKTNDEYANTALHFAVLCEDHTTMRLLLAKKASLSIANSDGDLPLHLVANAQPDNRVNLTTILLESKEGQAVINTQNNAGDTVLHLAVQTNDATWLRFLLEKFGPILDLKIKNRSLETPLELANKFSRSPLATMLAEYKKPVA